MKNDFYPLPEFTYPFLETDAMKRLKKIGMNCGVEYTSFSLFRTLKPYSRYDHSLGCAAIVWHFTKDEKQTLAALFHDIATPVFAHSVDFMNGDYLKQESTEEKTEEMILKDKRITELLKNMNISVDEVKDYHIYPIADNDSPRLSSDRLEYTIGNGINYGFVSKEEMKEILNDLLILINEEGEIELGFNHIEWAKKFGLVSLACSEIYVSPIDRYAMELIGECLKEALTMNIIREDDLYSTEEEVIALLKENEYFLKKWTAITKLDEVFQGCMEGARIIHAKKRWIDPYVKDKGRLCVLDEGYNKKVRSFLNESQDVPLWTK